MSRSLAALVLAAALAGCVPAQVTPPVPAGGTPFVIADGRFISGTFQVDIPPGWRVVTGEAGAPLLLTLVAPDECGVIVISAAPLESVVRSPGCGDAALREDLRVVEVAGRRYHISASAADAAWAAFAAALEDVVVSMRDEG